MLSKLKLTKNIQLIFVLRHKWENKQKIFNTYAFHGSKRLGFFFNKSRCVGNDNNFKNCTGKSFIIGLELIYIKMWIHIDYKVLKLEI